MNTSATHSSQIPPGSGRPIPKVTVHPTQRQRARRNKGLTLLAKAKSKIRDSHRCQFPGCHVQGVGRVESMHLEDAGMGGRLSVSDQAKRFVTGCPDHHQGPRSVHSTHVEMRPQTEDGGDGLVDWFVRETLDDDWFYFGTSRPVGSPR